MTDEQQTRDSTGSRKAKRLTLTQQVLLQTADERPGGDSPDRRTSARRPLSRRSRWAIVLATFVLTPVVVGLLAEPTGFSSFAIFFLPAAVSGLLLRYKIGLLFSAAVAPVSIALSVFLGRPFESTLLPALIGVGVCVLVTIVCDRVSFLSSRWRKEQRQREVAEASLKLSRELYRTLYQHAADSVLIIDPETPPVPLIVDANQVACKMHGYTHDEISGLPLTDIVSEADPEKIAGRIDQLLAGEVLSFESSHVRKDGTVFPVEVVACRIDAGDRPYIQAIDRDISQRKATEREKEKLAAQYQQAQKMEAIGRLAGGVAHDINNVLGAIMGAASAEKNDASKEHRSADAIDDILVACRQGRDLTKNLLGFARKGRGAIERFSMQTLIDETIALVKRTAPKGVEIEIATQPGLLHVDGDRGQIGQALMNVCVNALDAMGESGRLIVTARNKTVSSSSALEAGRIPGARYVDTTISDTGGGFDEQILDRVFEPFFSTKQQGEGTGLGMSMVYGAITGHGGTVSIANDGDVGANVTISLPGFAPTDDDRQESVPIQHEPPAGDGVVLIVDDERLVRRSGQRMVERLGYEVLLAGSGQEAIEHYAYRKDGIRLTILDLAMPGLDGKTTFRRLREIDDGARILISSGFAKDGTIDELIAAGAVGFIQKPYEMEELEAALEGLDGHA